MNPEILIVEPLISHFEKAEVNDRVERFIASKTLNPLTELPIMTSNQSKIMKTENNETLITTWLDRYMADITAPARKFFAILATAGEMAGDIAPKLNMDFPQDYDSKIRVFGSFQLMSLYGIYQSGKLLVQMMRERDDTFDVLLKAYPHLNARHLLFLQEVGEDRRDPRTLLMADASMQGRIEHLPIADQRTVLDNQPISIVHKSDSGEIVTERKAFKEMSRAEKRTAIGVGKIRTPSEQAERLHKVERRATTRFVETVEGLEVFAAPCFIKWADLEVILARNKHRMVGTLQTAMKKKQIRI